MDVFRDGLGIPHVRGATIGDAFFAQGYVHAQDRLWQMTLDRYRAGGRAAELLGPVAVTTDAFMRRMGIATSARDDYSRLDATTREVLDAYASGVNASVADAPSPPVEHRLLGLDPEPWEPSDCIGVLKVRHVLMGGYGRKLWRLRLIAALGPEATVDLASADGAETTLVVPVDGTTEWSADRAHLEPSALATAALADGSNNWAVHGSRTGSGLPLLAGDPHRALEVPGVYYQNHVACADFDAIGLSMAGVPGMFHFGHNAQVAWCITHAMADVQDLYVERFDAGGRYASGDQWRSPERSTEVLRVRGSDDVEIEVVRTHHGPAVFGDPSSGAAVTMRWTSTDGVNTTPRAILPMLLATSSDELLEAMRWWVEPCNSLVTADRSGTIAYLHRGRVPVRSPANAWAPVPGWTGEHEWQGDVPFDELPRLRDPEAGFIVTANNRVCGPDYPHHLGMDYAGPNRARRIIERLRSLERARATDMAAIHADRVSVPSRTLAAELAAIGSSASWGRLSGGSGTAGHALAVLEGWDGSMDPDSPAACVYGAVRQAMAEVLLEHQPLARVVTHPFPGDPDPTEASYFVRVALPRLLARRDRPPLDTVPWDEVLREAVDRAVAQLAARLGPEPERWRWGDVHTTAITHPLSAVLGRRELDPPPVSTGGDGDCVQASSAEVGLGVEHTSVARYVFDLADWDASGWVVPLGASGDPASPHYADQAETWARVELYPMTYSWDLIETEAVSHRRLERRAQRPAR